MGRGGSGVGGLSTLTTSINVPIEPTLGPGRRLRIGGGVTGSSSTSSEVLEYELLDSLSLPTTLGNLKSSEIGWALFFIMIDWSAKICFLKSASSNSRILKL